MNPFKNLLAKVKSLLKEDDALTKTQSEIFQWHLLIKIKEKTFSMGKGGVNTIFYTASSDDRAVCYPDEALDLLEKLAKRNFYMYVVYSKNKKPLGYSIEYKSAQNIKNAHYIRKMNFSGKTKPYSKLEYGIVGKPAWNITAPRGY